MPNHGVANSAEDKRRLNHLSWVSINLSTTSIIWKEDTVQCMVDGGSLSLMIIMQRSSDLAVVYEETLKLSHTCSILTSKITFKTNTTR